MILFVYTLKHRSHPNVLRRQRLGARTHLGRFPLPPNQSKRERSKDKRQAAQGVLQAPMDLDRGALSGALAGNCSLALGLFRNRGLRSCVYLL